ncbi:MAG TPA: hypothetical protein VEF53_03845 [Patescibacteria group bacterium]|nr:hypothetical protein [Patescibacteria group bacterium]
MSKYGEEAILDLAVYDLKRQQHIKTKTKAKASGKGWNYCARVQSS